MLQIPFVASFTGEVPYYTPHGYGFVTGTELRAYPELRIPEINSGFEPMWWYRDREYDCVRMGPEGAEVYPAACVREKDLEGRSLPLWFKADTGPGQYRVTVTLSTTGDSQNVLLFIGRRRLCWRGR